MGVAASRITGAEIAVVSAARQALTLSADTAPARCFVWCRDDEEAALVRADAGTAILAADIETLAWELVRRLTGDLREMDVERSDLASVQPSVGSDETSPAAGYPETAPTRMRREGRLPATPHWAQGVAQRSPASNRSGAAGRPEPPLSGSTSELREPLVSAVSPRPRAQVRPLTPLQALAEASPVNPSREVSAPHDELAPVEIAVDPTRSQGWSGLGRVRELIGRRDWPRRQRSAPDLSGLGQVLFRAHSTVVAVGTPKGGPGKTTEAAALGVLGARAVEPHGGSAVLVDANLNNPDSWRQLAVPSEAITVREVVDALNRGALVPNGEFARSERLRVLPERRSAGSAYSAAEISRLTEHLRLRHTLIVVDLPNSLPSLSEGPKEALVAHWLQHADVVVLPIDLGEASFLAAGEILDAIEAMVAGSGGRLRMPGLVVPLLVASDGRRAIELPAIADLLDHLRDAGANIVEVPFTVDVQTASHRRSPIVGASPRTDRAFVAVLSAVVAARRSGAEGIPLG
jgi:MinD-like ATPase involved in chromosome partitioning or flagellar assembly